ncbi:MAG: radical SAM protein [Anaerolineales bacterium]|nr:radical SAM protein [Anaerolineales bacterium]
MKLDSLHILLTYTCNYECDHCFVWGSPRLPGVFTLEGITQVLHQAHDTGTIREIYFEGGEAFLYYPLLLESIRWATALGFSTGVVTNGYWATTEDDARLWLAPLLEAGLDAVDVSIDDFHAGGQLTNPGEAVQNAAQALGMASSTITITHSGDSRDPTLWRAGLPLTGGDVMFRGRAAEMLVGGLPRQPWSAFPTCPYENLETPHRLHLDPLGNLHICQGLVIGNLFKRPLIQILEEFDPRQRPPIDTLIAGGPSLLIERYLQDRQTGFVDACHACYTARLSLRERFPEVLIPDQMYGLL